MDDNSLILGVVFGVLGLGYLRYGKLAKRTLPYVCGIGLMIFPYFVSGTWPTALIGLLLLALPFVLRY